MQTRTKIIIIAVSGLILFIAGGISGGLIVRNHYKPTPPDPTPPSEVTIISGQPGSIVVFNELFYNDYFTADIKSTGESKAKYKLMRPERWKENPKSHFIGFGGAISLVNSDFLYGGYISYRYRLIADFSLTAEYFMMLNQQAKYNTGFKLGVEFGIK